MALNVTDQDFERVVIEGSRTAPVVVDFWAAWCAPCRSLGPIIERVSEQTGVTLAKLDVDASPAMAAAFGVRSIPMVMAFRDGRPVDMFVGAQPEHEVRAFFDRLKPSEADVIVEAARGLDDQGRAEGLYRQALEIDRNHEGAIVGLSELLIARGDGEEARTLLARLPDSSEVLRLRAQLDLAGVDGDLGALRARVDADPGDLDAVVALGRAEAAAGRYEEALSLLLGGVQRGSDDARAAMVDVFRIMGDDHPLTAEYRRRLAAALF